MTDERTYIIHGRRGQEDNQGREGEENVELLVGGGRWCVNEVPSIIWRMYALRRRRGHHVTYIHVCIIIMWKSPGSLEKFKSIESARREPLLLQPGKKQSHACTKTPKLVVSKIPYDTAVRTYSLVVVVDTTGRTQRIHSSFPTSPKQASL